MVRILAIAKLHHAFANHFQPLADCGSVRQVSALRPVKWTRSELRKVHVIDFERLPLFAALVCMGIYGAITAVRDDYDAVVAFTPIPYGLIGLFISRVSRRPLHVGIIDERPLERLSGVRGMLARWVIRNATTVSVPGDSGVSDVTGVFPDLAREDRVCVLPHGLAPEYFASSVPLSRDRPLDGLFVGDLLPVKRVDFIIRAWAHVVARYPGSRLCIVGDGPERPALEKLISNLGLEASVLFAGYQESVTDYYRESRLLIMASASEGLPFALIEAMACGAVPVVNDVGNIGTLVENSVNGVLLNREASESQYADKIVGVLGDPAGLRALRFQAMHSVAHLTYKSVTETWERILKRLEA